MSIAFSNLRDVILVSLGVDFMGAFFAERYRSATTPAGAGRAQARHVTAGVVVL
jgi:hypothetical protein